MDLTTALKEYFGYTTFKPGQEEVLQEIMAGNNCLGILPTGTGKTLCYSLPGLLRPGLTLIVSPLIALMEEQSQRLNQLQKNSAAYLNSSLNKEQQDYLLQRLGRLKFLLLSPEMLQSPRLMAQLTKISLQMAVLDEAHCLSQWGFDFRPEYLQVLPQLQRLQVPQILALTATCTPQVAEDIARYLFKDVSYELVRLPVDRPNIGLIVKTLPDEDARQAFIATTLPRLKAPGIIYCNTRRKTEELTATLLQLGLKASYYHGGLKPQERQVLQRQFRMGTLDWMVATNAFGMGINKNNLRAVLHYELPQSLEHYVQEIGRCGRDGAQGVAILLYVPQDERVQQHFARQRQEWVEHLAQERVLPEHNVADFWQKQISQQPTAKDKILTLLKERNHLQLQQQQAMLAYIHEEGCLRQKIAAYFHDPAPQENSQCCSFHQLAVTAYFNEEQVTAPPTMPPTTWQEHFHQLFPRKTFS